ncbi:hypothetical protein [Actinomadura violacea]|uniref:Uncharacterized protein n=1 Tax=Actinomadura violacea TaxID=2819934 RepID=A0ABS3RSC2_9ACTN|nr:hypothetical protein [Actinomadura violacea]MBO2459649.1 hypothetical protein [Actinomadura violacea]
MRDPRRSPAAVRWLLALALGLLGLAGAPAPGALDAASGGPGASVRAAAVQYAAGHASSPRPAHAAAATARHHAGPAAPAAPGAFASAGPDVRPALVRTVRPAAGHTEPVVAATGAPRGRAPPLATRI